MRPTGPLAITTYTPYSAYIESATATALTFSVPPRRLFSRSRVCLFAVVGGILKKCAEHRTTDDSDENAPRYGSLAICWLTRADPETRPRWLAAGAGGVLRGIAAADTIVASTEAKNEARSALRELGLQARTPTRTS